MEERIEYKIEEYVNSTDLLLRKSAPPAELTEPCVI